MNNPDLVIASLSSAPKMIIPLVYEVPVKYRKRRPLPRKWSAHEHACHLAEVNPVFLARLDKILSEPTPRITSYLPDKAEEEGALLKVDLDEAMDRFSRDRANLVVRLKELGEHDWGRIADHEEYSHYSVFIMFRHLAMHDMLHAFRIEELLLKKDWA